MKLTTFRFYCTVITIIFSFIFPLLCNNLFSQNEVISNHQDSISKVILPLPKNSYQFADSIALSIKHSPFYNVQTLTQKLINPIKIDSVNGILNQSTIDSLRLRAIFRWICENVQYDVYSARTGRFKEFTGNAVSKSKLAVCEGYAQL